MEEETKTHTKDFIGFGDSIIRERWFMTFWDFFLDEWSNSPISKWQKPRKLPRWEKNEDHLFMKFLVWEVLRLSNGCDIGTLCNQRSHDKLSLSTMIWNMETNMPKIFEKRAKQYNFKGKRACKASWMCNVKTDKSMSVFGRPSFIWPKMALCVSNRTKTQFISRYRAISCNARIALCPYELSRYKWSTRLESMA